MLVSPVGVPHPEDLSGRLAAAPWYVKGLIRTARGLWQWNVSPQALVRGLGPWGPGLVRGYVFRRFTGAGPNAWVL